MIYTIDGRWMDYATLSSYFDDKIYSDLLDELTEDGVQATSNQKFYNLYAAKHLYKFGKEFIIN
jgi:hypothetical protein